MLSKVVKVNAFPVFGWLTARLSMLLIVVALPLDSQAKPQLFSHASTSELEYGVVLFDFFQQDYFSALIEQSYAEAIENPSAKNSRGQVLKGGMMLSYGMTDESKKIFDQLLDITSSEAVKNRAWFYLAKLFYGKSDLPNAAEALNQVSGKIPDDLHADYHYLATLLNKKGDHLGGSEATLNAVAKDATYYPYLLFNLAILQLQDGNLETAVKNLETVTRFSGASEELSLLADRARHGLSELAVQHGRLPQAWIYLKDIRTTGLYSNRALLSYAWAAINLKQFNVAIPALELLNNRSIAIPEVQEAKVLLAHLYEQEGSPRKALRSNLIAEKEYQLGIDMVADARDVLRMQDVPREFIQNLDAMIDDTDWYSARPSVDYKKLTPFLIDLMANHPFNETLRELADLYAIEENLKYWLIQAREHQLILENAGGKTFDDSVLELVKQSTGFKQDFAAQNTELRLYTLTLEESEQDRLTALMQTTERELALLGGKIEKLKTYQAPYQQPASYQQMVADKHQQITDQLAETEKFISSFEATMRNLVNAELDVHEERMRYYSAQSRLAKARLYDMTLLSLEKAKSTVNTADFATEGDTQ
jgi:hypothetical protein